MPELLNVLLPLIFILCYIAVGFFYCLSQRSAIRVVKPQNRRLPPGIVWIQLIPFVGVVANVVLITFIANSFRAELDSIQDDSILGMDAETAEQLGKRPTLGLGITYVSLYILFFLCSALSPYVFVDANASFKAWLVLSIFGIATVFFVLYWIKLVRTKRKIAGLTR